MIKKSTDQKMKDARKKIRKRLEKNLMKAFMAGDFKLVVDIQFILRHI